jgi:hypothetical protein
MRFGGQNNMNLVYCHESNHGMIQTNKNERPLKESNLGSPPQEMEVLYH